MYPGAYVAKNPDKPAVTIAETGESITYAELESQSCQIARHLRDRGLRQGDVIAVVATNIAEIFPVYWAAMRSGLYITAVNWHLTPAEMAYIVEDCGARVLFVDIRLESSIRQLTEHLGEERTVFTMNGRLDGFTELSQAIATVSNRPLDHQPRGGDMLYSSGTTGKPKGIKPALQGLQVHEAGDTMVGLVQTFGGAEDTVYLSPAPLYHAAPLRFCAAIQSLGGTAVVMERFDPENALEAIERYRATMSQWVPTMFTRMLKLDDETRLEYDVSSMQVAIHAAAPCPIGIKRQMIDWWGPILVEYYSSTEANGLTAVSSEQWLERPGTVGFPLLGTIRICDDLGDERPTGEVGTVYFERDQVPFEYYNSPEKTKDSQHPDHPTWTTTGDVGYVDDDGWLYLTDRKSFMIISGGVNIYPQEIENALIEHPKVLDAGVLGMPDDDMGEIVVAVVHPRAGPTENTDDTDAPETGPSDELAGELTEYLSGRMAAYKIPRRFEFSEELPRTPTGKMVKRKLRDWLAAQPARR